MINHKEIEDMLTSEGATLGLESFHIFERELGPSQTNIPRTYHRFGSFGLSIRQFDPEFDIHLIDADIKAHKIKNLVIERKLTDSQLWTLANYLTTDSQLQLIGFSDRANLSDTHASNILNAIANNANTKISNIVFCGKNITDATVSTYSDLWEKGLLSPASIKFENTNITDESIKLLTKIACSENSELLVVDFSETLKSNKNITDAERINSVYHASKKNKFQLYGIFDILFDGDRYQRHANDDKTNIKKFLLIILRNTGDEYQRLLSPFHQAKYNKAKESVDKLDEICAYFRLDKEPFIDWIILKSNISTLDQLIIFINRVNETLLTHKRSAQTLFTMWAADQKREDSVIEIGILPKEIINRILQIAAGDAMFPVLRESTAIENASEEIESCFKKPFFNLI